MLVIWEADAIEKRMIEVAHAPDQLTAEAIVERYKNNGECAVYVIAEERPCYDLDSETHEWLLAAQQ